MKPVALPGLSADASLAAARAAVERTSAPAFVVRDQNDFFVVPSSSVTTAATMPGGDDLAALARTMGEPLRDGGADQAVSGLVRRGGGLLQGQFQAEVDVAVRSKLWKTMFETAAVLRCTLNHSHVYRADQGYEECPRDGAPLEPAGGN